MELRNILVALDDTPASDAALGAAVAMQRSYRAHLTGFVAHAESLRQAMVDNAWLPQAIVSSLQQSGETALAAIEASFAKATAGLDPALIHLVAASESSDTSVAEASRFFDATLVGIPRAAPRQSRLHPDRIALLSGRPVIAFPPETDVTKVASRAIVAWDGSRAAARALSSATRLLDTKEEVAIVTIGDNPKALVEASGFDPVTALERQGVNASWINVPAGRGSVAETLLAQAERLGAGLIVMGAFEHSKFREDLLGGVTHDVMANTKIPVFLAH